MKTNVIVVLMALLIGCASATDIDAVSGGTAASATSGAGDTASAGTSFSLGTPDGNDEMSDMTTGAYSDATTAWAGNTGPGTLDAPVASAWVDSAVADGSPTAHAEANVGLGTMTTCMQAGSSGSTAWASQDTDITAAAGDATTSAESTGFADASATSGLLVGTLNTQQYAFSDDSMTPSAGPVASAQQNTGITAVGGNADTAGTTTGSTSADVHASMLMGTMTTQQLAYSDWGGSTDDWWNYAQQDTNIAALGSSTETNAATVSGSSGVSSSAGLATQNVVSQAYAVNGVTTTPSDNSWAREDVDMSGLGGSISALGQYDAWVPNTASSSFLIGNFHRDAWSGETDTPESQWAYTGPDTSYVPVLWPQWTYPACP